MVPKTVRMEQFGLRLTGTAIKRLDPFSMFDRVLLHELSISKYQESNFPDLYHPFDSPSIYNHSDVWLRPGSIDRCSGI